jgi:hypothetical protein
VRQIHSVEGYYVGERRPIGKINVTVDHYTLFNGIDVPQLNRWFFEPLHVYCCTYDIRQHLWTTFFAIYRNDLSDVKTTKLESNIFKRESKDSQLLQSVRDGSDLREAIGR